MSATQPHVVSVAAMEVSANWRIVACWLAFLAIVLGIIVSDDNSARALSALAAVCFALIAVYTDFSILWVLSAAIVLALTGQLASACHTSEGGVVAGYVMMLVGIWIPALVHTPTNIVERGLATAFSGVMNIAGTVLLIVAIVAMVLLWSQVGDNGEGADHLAASFDLAVIVVLFIRASWWNDVVWKRISLFWFSYYQVGLLSAGLDSSGTLEAAYVLAWIAVVGFVLLLIAAGEVQVKLDFGNIAKLPSILVAVTLVVAIVGAAMMHDVMSEAGRWTNAVAAMVPAMLLLGLLCNSYETGRGLFINTALAFSFATIGELFLAARQSTDADMDQESAGAALMIVAIFLAFFFQSGAGLGDAKEVAARTMLDKLAIFAAVGIVIGLAGIITWGVYSDESAQLASEMSLLGLCVLNLLFFASAFYLARPWCLLNLFTSSLLAVYVMVDVASKAVLVRDGGGPGDATVGQLGTTWSWIALVIFILCQLAVLPRDHNRAAEDGVGGAGAAEQDQGAGPGRLSEPYNPAPSQKNDQADQDDQADDLEAGSAEQASDAAQQQNDEEDDQ